MNDYRLTLGIEPTDRYKKAKQDLLQALRSFEELSPQEKECLLEELFGAANVALVIDFFKTFKVR